MNVQIITLRQGEGPDTPKNGDIVTVDVTVWEFDDRGSGNNYKGNQYAIFPWPRPYLKLIQFPRIIDKKGFVFVVGKAFPEGMHLVNPSTTIYRH